MLNLSAKWMYLIRSIVRPFLAHARDWLRLQAWQKLTRSASLCHRHRSDVGSGSDSDRGSSNSAAHSDQCTHKYKHTPQLNQLSLSLFLSLSPSLFRSLPRQRILPFVAAASIEQSAWLPLLSLRRHGNCAQWPGNGYPSTVFYFQSKSVSIFINICSSSSRSLPKYNNHLNKNYICFRNLI